MRCTYRPCQSGDTRLSVRTCQLIYGDDGRVVNYDVSELWYCRTCGNTFFQTIKAVKPAFLRYEKPPRPGEKAKARRVSKVEIVEELFRRS